jgi:hypothetical protein
MKSFKICSYTHPARITFLFSTFSDKREHSCARQLTHCSLGAEDVDVDYGSPPHLSDSEVGLNAVDTFHLTAFSCTTDRLNMVIFRKFIECLGRMYSKAFVKIRSNILGKRPCF